MHTLVMAQGYKSHILSHRESAIVLLLQVNSQRQTEQSYLLVYHSKPFQMVLKTENKNEM